MKKGFIKNIENKNEIYYFSWVMDPHDKKRVMVISWCFIFDKKNNDYKANNYKYNCKLFNYNIFYAVYDLNKTK